MEVKDGRKRRNAGSEGMQEVKDGSDPVSKVPRATAMCDSGGNDDG